jgi:hypothetical protein
VKVAASWMLAFVPTWALAVGVAVGVPQSVLAPVKELARTEARQHARTSASRAFRIPNSECHRFSAHLQWQRHDRTQHGEDYLFLLPN